MHPKYTIMMFTAHAAYTDERIKVKLKRDSDLEFCIDFSCDQDKTTSFSVHDEIFLCLKNGPTYANFSSKLEQLYFFENTHHLDEVHKNFNRFLIRDNIEEGTNKMIKEEGKESTNNQSEKIATNNSDATVDKILEERKLAHQIQINDQVNRALTKFKELNEEISAVESHNKKLYLNLKFLNIVLYNFSINCLKSNSEIVTNEIVEKVLNSSLAKSVQFYGAVTLVSSKSIGKNIKVLDGLYNKLSAKVEQEKVSQQKTYNITACSNSIDATNDHNNTKELKVKSKSFLYDLFRDILDEKIIDEFNNLTLQYSGYIKNDDKNFLDIANKILAFKKEFPDKKIVMAEAIIDLIKQGWVEFLTVYSLDKKSHDSIFADMDINKEEFPYDISYHLVDINSLLSGEGSHT